MMGTVGSVPLSCHTVNLLGTGGNATNGLVNQGFAGCGPGPTNAWHIGR
jgi:hypothetical protein